jgi:hypothetical protein
MTNMLKYLIPSVLLFAACQTKSESPETTEKKPEQVVINLANEAQMDARRTEIDSIVSKAGLIASSLYYSKGETGESIEVNGYMNEDNVILKVEELFNDGNGKNSGRRLYYLNGGAPFMTIEEFDDVSQTPTQFVDRISYYDQKGKVLKTKMRQGPLQDITETLPYTPAPLNSVSIARAMRALNQEKEFETTFQGFIHQDVFSYISVGENRPNGFHSALRLDYKDPLIVALSANEKGYIGEPLRVNYQKHTDDSGFQFQVYAGGEFKIEVE